MSHVSEPRVLSASPNIQDAFLNGARRDRLTLIIKLLDGRELAGRIKNFDRFSVIVEVGGVDWLVFKHAIATVASDRTMSSYLPSDRA